MFRFFLAAACTIILLLFLIRYPDDIAAFNQNTLFAIMVFNKWRRIAVALLLCSEPAASFLSIQSPRGARPVTFVKMADIISPFDDSSAADGKSGPGASTTKTIDDGPLELTWENVELVLDSMRSYLIQDGGNVVISEIDGPVVRLELQVGFLSMFYSILCFLAV